MKKFKALTVKELREIINQEELDENLRVILYDFDEGGTELDGIMIEEFEHASHGKVLSINGWYEGATSI